MACVEPVLDRADAAPRGAALRPPRRWAGNFFCNSGAEANEAAIKYARKATSRTRIVALERVSRTDARRAVYDRATRRSGRVQPALPGVTFAPPNDVEALGQAISPGDLALVLLEPVIGEGGVVPLDDDFVHAAAQMAREVGALLCLDEVQTGIGRTGTFFAFEQLGIEPDLVTLRLGNGLRGALLARAPVPASLPAITARPSAGIRSPAPRRVRWSRRSTTSCSAGVQARGAQLIAGVAALPGVVETHGRGLLLGATLERPVAPVVDVSGSGLLVLSAGPDVLRLAPPLTVTEPEVAEALTVLGTTLAQNA